MDIRIVWYFQIRYRKPHKLSIALLLVLLLSHHTVGTSDDTALKKDVGTCRWGYRVDSNVKQRHSSFVAPTFPSSFPSTSRLDQYSAGLYIEEKPNRVGCLGGSRDRQCFMVPPSCASHFGEDPQGFKSSATSCATAPETRRM